MLLWSAALSQPMKPVGTAQLCSRRRCSCSGVAMAAEACGLISGRSLEGAEIAEQGPEIVRSEEDRRHQRAGLQALRVGDPAAEGAAIVRQQSRGDRDAARDMREVRTRRGSCRRAGYGVTHGAGAAEEDLLAAPLVIGL